MSVNDKPIRHLAIETVDGQTRGLFNNLEEEELQWLSARLKNSLGLTFKSRLDVKRAWSQDGTLIIPKATRIKADQRVGETVIEIPPATLLQHIGNLVGTLLALAFVSVFIYVGIVKGEFMFLLIPGLMAIGLLVWNRKTADAATELVDPRVAATFDNKTARLALKQSLRGRDRSN